MLTCDEATRLVSLKRYKKLTFRERIQLSLHLFACKYCMSFAKFSDLIDDAIEGSCTHNHVDKQHLSKEKKQELYDLVNKDREL